MACCFVFEAAATGHPAPAPAGSGKCTAGAALGMLFGSAACSPLGAWAARRPALLGQRGLSHVARSEDQEAQFEALCWLLDVTGSRWEPWNRLRHVETTQFFYPTKWLACLYERGGFTTAKLNQYLGESLVSFRNWPRQL